MSLSVHRLEKNITENKNISFVLGSTIKEYDIKSAGATALLFLLKDKELYEKLINMDDKKLRNVQIGNIQKKHPELTNQMNKLFLKWKNMFLEANRIRTSQFLYSNKDAITITNRVPSKRKFENDIVEFVNKEGEFSSMYKINGFRILFDSMKFRIKIIGINDEIVEESEFANGYLKNVISSLEKVKSLGFQKTINLLIQQRESYIDSLDENLYRSLADNNKFVYQMKNGKKKMFNEYMGRENLIREVNYTGFVMPIINTIF